MAEKKAIQNNFDPTSVRYDDRKRDFRTSVKKRVYEEYSNSLLKPEALLKKLDKLGYNVNKGTLKKMLDPLNESTFDLWIIKGLCECFNISLGELLGDPMYQAVPSVKVPESIEEVVEVAEVEEDKEDKEDPDVIAAKNKFEQDFFKYFGTFYCYSNSKNFGNNDLVEFKLEISKETCDATLTYLGDIDRENDDNTKSYVCVPKLLEKNHVVMLEFEIEDHSFFHFYFKYSSLFTSKLYHRRGFYVSTSTDEEHEGAPLINGFVLFNKQLTKSDAKKYVPTLLTLDNTKFVIREDIYKHIMQDVPELSTFLTKYKENVEEHVGFCIINEAEIIKKIGKIKPKEDQSPAFALLVQIKSHADNCTQLTFNEERPYARFAYYHLPKREEADENQ